MSNAVPKAWALIPVGPFAAAKSRLEPALSRSECASLAEQMLKDVLRALNASPEILGVALLGNEPRLASLAEAAGARIYAEAADTDYQSALGQVAAELAASGVRTLLVLPADLPTLTTEDIGQLLRVHGTDASAESPRLTLVPATRDGGSNALVLSPPTAIPFLFGPDSARRHTEAAAERNVTVRQVAIPGFDQDIDTPADVEWLLTRRVACATLVWLKTSGVGQRLKPGGKSELTDQ